MDINDVRRGKAGDIFRVVTSYSVYSHDVMALIKSDRLLDHLLMLYDGANKKGIYYYNPYGFSAVDHLEFQYLGSGDLIDCINTF